MNLVALYPGPASDRAAQFRVITLGNENPPVLRTLNDVDVPVLWAKASIPYSSRDLNLGIADISNLSPDTEISVKAMENGVELRRATVRTLPVRLGSESREFKIFLASCYCRLNPSSRRANELFADMCRAYGTPHLKIWCGDQVYLDSPANHFMTHWKETSAEIAESHLAHYLATWDEDHLGVPLARGANVFTLDDHEYWNNAPYPNVVAPGLYDKVRRGVWTDVARNLIGTFQGVPQYLNKAITVPPVSVFVIDTRTNRTPDGPREEFMTAMDLAKLSHWVESLGSTGPGILVLGQPLFHGPGDKWFKPGFLDDFSLADYPQFGELLKILDSTPRDIAILTGDVHFSRAARMTLTSGKSLFEIINSPLALVVGCPRSKPSNAKGFEKIPGVGPISSSAVVTDKTFRSNLDSAVALTLTQAGQHVHVKVDLWPSDASPGASKPTTTHEFDLY